MSATCAPFFIALISSVCAAAAAEVTFPDSETAEETVERGVEAESGARVASMRLRAIAGSPFYRDTKLYQRLELRNSPDLTFFGLLEKDAGEAAVADYQSFYGRWTPTPGREIVLGDLRPGFARGLVFSRSPSRNGSAMPSIGRDSRHLGHRSSSENAAFRGAAVRIKVSGVNEFLFMAGVGRRDARRDESGVVRSLPQSGLHITEPELRGKDQLRSIVTGLRFRRGGARRSVGLTLQGVRYDPAVDLRRAGRVAHGFVGRSQERVGVDASFARSRHAALSVEAAFDSDRERAFEAAGRVALGPARIGGLIQLTSASFHNLFGAQAGSSDRNEQRTLLVAEGKGQGTTWRLYAEQLARPEPTLTNPMRTVRDAWGLETGRALRRRMWVALALQRRQSSHWRASSGAYETRQIRGRLDGTYRFGGIDQGRWTGSARLRLEGTRHREAGGDVDDGLAASISLKGKGRGLDYALLLTRFTTDSYGARLYEYEWDLPGTISVRPLFGAGWRAVALSRWRWGQFSLAVRYRCYRDRERAAQLLGLQVEI